MNEGAARGFPSRFMPIAGLIVVIALRHGQAQVITTIAGGNFSGPGPSFPVGRCGSIACDQAGNCYVSGSSVDSFYSTTYLYKIDSSGSASIFAGNGIVGYTGDGGPARQAAISAATGIAVDRQNNVYIGQGGLVRKIGASGIISTVAGLGSSGFFEGGVVAVRTTMIVYGIAVDSGGTLYIADAGYGLIWKVDAAGILTRIAGIRSDPGYTGDGGPATLAKVQPSSIGIDGAGNIYFGDTSNRRVRKITPEGIISTIAGNGADGASGDGGPATQATLSSTFRVSAGETGNVYITDSLSYRVRRVSPAGVITTVAGGSFGALGDGQPAVGAALHSPYEASADSSGNLYISDSMNYRVRKVNAAGIISTHAGNGLEGVSGDGGPAANARLEAPGSLATDSGGNIYVAEQVNRRVRRIAPNGTITTVAGGGTRAPIDGMPAADAIIGPSAVTVDSNGYLYIAEASGNRIWKVTRDGTLTLVAGGGPNSWFRDVVPATSVNLIPMALAVAPNGDLYFVDGGAVGKLSGGMLYPVAGTNPSGSGADGTPAVNAYLGANSIALDARGNLYIGGSSIVRRVDAAGMIYRVAGDRQNSGYAGDGGPATSALLESVTSLSCDSAGNLYIGGDRRIRKIDSSGIIRTFAFDGTTGFDGDGGPALSAQLFLTAAGMAFDPAGNLLMADGHSRVRKIDSSVNAGPLPPRLHNLGFSTEAAGSDARALPVTGANFTPQSVVRWNGTARATVYRNSNVLEATIGVEDLAQPGTAAVSVFTAGTGSSNSLLFIVAGEPRPAVPIVLSPSNGASGVELSPVLSWAPSAGASAYDIYFGTNSTPRKLATVNTNSYALAGLEAFRGYYWYVAAVNRVWQTASALQQFTTGNGTVTETGLRFVPVTPCRVADTRASQGTSGSFGPPELSPGATREIPIPAGRCLIPATARAYSLNVTAVPREPLAYLSLWPSGEARPLVSTLNSFHGGIVANAAIVPAGTNGSISVFVTNAADVILDINGYFEPGNGYAFYAVDPCRAADTRSGSGFIGAFGSPTPAAQSVRSFPLAGICGLPSTAAAYSLNVTVVPPAPLSFLTIWGSSQPQPFVSTLNSFDGAIVANAALVPSGAGGAVSTFVTDRTDAILDVNGYFGTAGVPGSLTFVPVTPCRIADTRTSGPVMATGEQRDFAIQGICGVPAGARSYSLNVTVVPAGPLSYLSLWPAGKGRPLVSTLNSFTGRIVANAALVPAGTGGSISVFAANETHVILDINGYFR